MSISHEYDNKQFDDGEIEQLEADAARWQCMLDHVSTIRESEFGVAVAIHLPIKRVNLSGPIRLADMVDRLIEAAKREER